MVIKEEILELLRSDEAFREEVRRQLFTEELLALPRRTEEMFQQQGEQIQALIEAQVRTEERVEALAEAQLRTEERVEALAETQRALAEEQRALTEVTRRVEGEIHSMAVELRELANWQRGEAGRHVGEGYERDIVKRAPALLNGGEGGATDDHWVQQRLSKLLAPLYRDAPFPRDEDPFLADLVWWKGDQIAVVEVSNHVNGYDVSRAAKRAETLRRAGAQALAVVIGRQWASFESRYEAGEHRVEWKVGSDLSDGFINFRRVEAG
jgi:hypothetical protein